MPRIEAEQEQDNTPFTPVQSEKWSGPFTTHQYCDTSH